MMSQENTDQSTTQNQPVILQEYVISLVDVLGILLRKKNIIFGVMIAVVAAAFAYMFTGFSSERVYQVEIGLVIPEIEDIRALRGDYVSWECYRNPITCQSRKEVLDAQNSLRESIMMEFVEIFESHKLHKKYFDENNLSEIITGKNHESLTDDEIAHAFKYFSESFSIDIVGLVTIAITLKGAEGEKISAWLNDMVEIVNRETISELARKTRSRLHVKIKELKNNINIKKLAYERSVEDEHLRLQQQRKVIKSLKGSGLLQTAADALKNSESYDAYINGLRYLQEQVVVLESIVIDETNLTAVIVSKEASTSVEPGAPKSKLIVTGGLSIILGLVLGILAAFFVNFIEKVKLQLREAQL